MVRLYYMDVSPCRAVMLAAEVIGLELELIETNVSIGEHLTPEYEQWRHPWRLPVSNEPLVVLTKTKFLPKLNPQKTVPFMVDDDFKLSESRAIMGYLADQYGQDDSFYPRNLEARALVNQRLYFDLEFSENICASYMPVLEKLIDACEPAQYEKVVHGFQVLEKFLEGQDHVAGNNLTIADCAVIASVTAAESFGFDVGNFENISNWLENMKTVPGYQTVIAEPIETFKKNYLKDEHEEGDKEEEEEKEEEEG